MTLWATAIASLLAMALVAITMADDGVKQPALVALVGVATVAPLIYRAIQGKFDPLEPITILLIGCFVIYFLRPVWMWMNEEWTFFSFDLRDGLSGASAIALLGVIALVVGYALPAGRHIANRIPVVRDDWDPSLVTVACVAIFLGAALLFSFHVGTEGGLGAVKTVFSGRSGFDATLSRGVGGTKASTSWFALAPVALIPLSLVMIEVARRRRTPLTMSLAGTFLILALMSTVFRGDRTFILALVMPLAALPYLHSGRRPRLLVATGVILASVLLANALLDYRRLENRDEGLATALLESARDPFREVDEFMLGVDTAMFPIMAAEYEHWKRYPNYLPGQTLTSTLVLPVPGLLWPEKPEDPAQTVYAELFPSYAAVTRAGFGPSMLGGFYADSWFAGVLVYSLLIGLALRVLFEYWRRQPQNRSVTIFFAAMLPQIIIMLRASPTLAIGGWVFMIAPIVFAFWWGNRRVPRGTSAA